jgi:haloalkane dehalogenase
MENISQRSFSVSQSYYPFESHWFEQQGCFTHYVDEEEGFPVLMLHGNPTWSFLYRKVIPQLKGLCRSIAPDYPGFGFSSHPPSYGYNPQEHAKWVNALIDHLPLSKFILVMQDWGGPIGMSIAVKHPEKVSGLVICNTWCWSPDTIKLRCFSAFVGSSLGKYLILKENFFVKRIAPFNRAMMTYEELQAYIAPFPTPASRIGTYVFPRAIRHEAKWLGSIESKIYLLNDKPVELIFGMKDTAFGNKKTISRWLRHFPNSRVERLPSAGHYLQEEAPKRVVAGIKRILERT